VPETAMTRRGMKMFDETGRVGNLEKAAQGDLDALQMDKVNDMGHALVGADVGVYDRQYAKLFERPNPDPADPTAKGVYAEAVANVLEPSMTPKDKPNQKGYVGSYATIENVMRTKAKAAGVPLAQYTAAVWEGIRQMIRSSGELFGAKYDASAIPDTQGGFNELFPAMVQEKAAALGITVAELHRRLRAGDAELLGMLLSTPVGAAAYAAWEAQAAPAQTAQ
jgi:hypothetical protein